MGVKGLWSLLNPVARPVQIESLEGKRLAIDSSIWLYQFQSTMRDKDGRVLINAHVLGFLRRINKLLFNGIKPVFVFDGGAPALKRSTIAERKRRKAGAAQNHAKMAEKLLAAQMRREAVRVTQEAEAARAARLAQGAYVEEEGERIPENAVYLDQLEGRAGPSTVQRAPVPEEETPEQRRKRLRKKDRYELPEATMPTVSTEGRPDARLATAEELQQFIDEVNPEDIDIESPEFRALPTEAQYEIIGDLRIRSRQQSHKRLVEMLRAAPTALDFSKAQIKHLSQRNALTQQLLTVTDMVGKAHLTIPIRVAAERNREYVLVKRDDGGGWALGVRDGTKEKPIELEPDTKPKVDDESDDSDSDSSVFSVEAPKAADDDLRQHRRQEVLAAIAARYAPVKLSKPVVNEPIQPRTRRPDAVPLFDNVDDVEDVVPTAHDEALALALQQEELGSDEEEADPDLARALALSRQENAAAEAQPKASPAPVRTAEGSSDDDEFEEVSLVPSGRTTPALMSGAETPVVVLDSDDSDIEVVEPPPQPSKRVSPPKTDPKTLEALVQDSTRQAVPSDSEDEFEEVISEAPRSKSISVEPVMPAAQELFAATTSARPPAPVSRPTPAPVIQSFAPRPALPCEAQPNTPPAPTFTAGPPPAPIAAPSQSVTPGAALRREELQPHARAHSPTVSPPVAIELDSTREAPTPPGRAARAPSPSPVRSLAAEEMSREASTYTEPAIDDTHMESTQRYDDHDTDEDEPIEWSRSPSPVRRKQPLEAVSTAMSLASEGEDDEDMAPADMVVEEDDYARFLAQITNRDLNEVRGEIDDEIRVLSSQTKAAMRDSDEITQAMVVQIQTLLRHFGIPYITAPMEAEAQCAKLAELGLVDGIITDDSDVFLFGGTQCFKNIFSDAKFAECFLSTDLERELSLTRERLISLAYLLGSDYTLGLMGVGPVLALELLANFPGPDGLDRFKQWWLRVQTGADLDVEADTKWKRSFKKRFAGSIHLTADWPNPHVREAYLYPTADESDEPFHWGFPRLAALRTFLHEELSWSISKVDDELTPIVQRVAKRGRGGLPVQGTLLPFFDHGVGMGTSYAPRRRTTANISKRLMAVIKEFREAEARAQGQQPAGWGEMLAGIDEADPKGLGKRKNVTAGASRAVSGSASADATGDEQRPKRRRKKAADGEDGDDEGAARPKRTRAARKSATSSAASVASDDAPRRRRKAA